MLIIYNFIWLLISITITAQIDEQMSEKLPDKIFAGQIHYARIPVQYWDHRIKMIKSMGLNMLSVYIMWNYHEISPGIFDYESGNKNLPYFLELAQKNQMKVLFRPGPYVCAEWDFGGLPARLFAIQGLQIRAHNSLFLEQVQIYFDSLVPIIRKYECRLRNQIGCIVLLQIQNQYGIFGSDNSYIQDLRKIWTDLGINTPQYYVDNHKNIKVSHWQGANIGINNGIQEAFYKQARSFQKTGIIFGGQIYVGWLTHWGQEQWGDKSLQKLQKDFTFLLKNNHSYSVYMAHGGTNFGLSAGSNTADKRYNFRGHVTSYDYNAPINQQGRATQKFYFLKNLISKYVDWQIPEIPEPIKTFSIRQFEAHYQASLTQNMGKAPVYLSQKYYPFQSNQLKMFNQGIVLYQAFLQKNQYIFQCIIHDYALIQLDGIPVNTLNRSQSEIHMVRINCQKQQCILLIIVEALGHINFDITMKNDTKGLLKFQQVNPQFSMKWSIYPIQLNQQIFRWTHGVHKRNGPALLKGSFWLLQEPADTYLSVINGYKGYLWVNGHNLGRYWNIGPQFSLYCPGVWMKYGQNIVYILQLHYSQQSLIIKGHEKL